MRPSAASVRASVERGDPLAVDLYMRLKAVGANYAASLIWRTLSDSEREAVSADKGKAA